MASVFRELLGKLAAEHERLEAEVAALRGTSRTRQHEDAGGIAVPKQSEAVPYCCGTSSAVAHKDEITVASECAVLTEEHIFHRNVSQARRSEIPGCPAPWQLEGTENSSIVKLSERQDAAGSTRLLESSDKLKMSLSKYLTEPDLGRSESDYMLWPVWNENTPFDLSRFSEMSRSSAMMTCNSPASGVATLHAKRIACSILW